jgi:hypothetical protein
MTSRERKALRTYLSRKVQRISDTMFAVQGRKRRDGKRNDPWLVRVNDDGVLECNCPAYGEEGHCKHADDVTKWLVEGDPKSYYPDADTKRPTYPQDWPRYRLVRHVTDRVIREMIRDLAQSASPHSDAPRKRGRPWLETADVVQCVCARGLINRSGDLADDAVQELLEKSFLFHHRGAASAPSPSAITRRMRSEDIRDEFVKLIRLTSLLTRDTDMTFAIDAGEYNVPNRDPHDPDLIETYKTSRKGKAIRPDKVMNSADDIIRKIVRGKTVRLHVLVAAKSRLVVAALVTDGKVNENPLLPKLVAEASTTHIIKELAADRGYVSEENAVFLAQRHIRALIPPKRGQRGKPGSALEQQRRDWFDQNTGNQEAAGKRECAEGFFSRNKRVEREYLRSRTFLAQQTELLSLVFLANIRQIIKHYIYGEIPDIEWLNVDTRRELSAAREKVKDLPHPDLSPRYRDGLGDVA